MRVGKKLMIGGIATLATTGIVGGTVALILRTNNVQTVVDEVNKNPSLKDEIAKLNKDFVLVKKTEDDSFIVDKNNKQALEDLYAFNITNKLLGLNSDIDLSSDIDVKFEIQQANASYLNAGKLDVKVELANKQNPNEKESTILSLDGFKVATKQDEEFKDLLVKDENSFVLQITNKNTTSDTETKYTSISYLNDIHTISLIDESGPESRRDGHDNEERLTKDETGLSLWMRNDQTNGTKLNDYSLTGQVKLNQIIKQSGSNSQVYFELVPIDQTQKIILSKDEKQIALDGIKTTNLLAEEDEISPIKQDEKLNKSFLETLRKTTDSDDENETDVNKKYLQDFKNESLNRDLSINLATDSSFIPLFIKPFLVKKEEGSDGKELPINISVKFGKDDYLTVYRTSEEKELEQLKNASFNFGIYIKKLENNDEKVKPSLFTNKKMELVKYFALKNSSIPLKRIEKDKEPSMTYPAGFSLEEKKAEMLDKDMKIKLNDQEVMMNQNFLVFVDYSYKAFETVNVSYTPSISLIRLETNTPLA